MNILLPEHQAFAAKLLEGKVDFLLIGGYAVIFHGYVRTTGDMDIWVKPTNQNRDKLIAVLKKEKVRNEDLVNLEARNFENMLAFHIGAAPTKIDFVTKIHGVEYDDADKAKVFFDTGGYKLPVIHYNHLVASKIASGRTKDKADIEELQKIMAKKK